MNETKNILYVLPVLSLLICYLFWRVRGRDSPGRYTIVPEYEPPLDLSPAEIGLLHDFKATDREITATLVDLAIRGYIAIHRISGRRLFGRYHSYEFELLNDNVLELKDHEKVLLDGLFGVSTVKLKAKLHASLNPEAKAKATAQYPATANLVGKKVRLQDLDQYFYEYVNAAKQDMHDSLDAKGYFKSDLFLAGTWFVLIGFVCLVPAVFLRGDILYTVIACGAIFVLFGVSMQARTEMGTLAKEHIDGFLMFLRAAEANKMNITQSVQTAPNAAGQIDLYERYLPYAIALGLEGSWSKQFQGTYDEPASWLNAARPLDEITNLVSSVHASFVTRRH